MSDVGCDARPRFEDVARVAQLPKFPWGRRSAQCGESSPLQNFSHKIAEIKHRSQTDGQSSVLSMNIHVTIIFMSYYLWIGTNSLFENPERNTSFIIIYVHLFFFLLLLSNL